MRACILALLPPLLFLVQSAHATPIFGNEYVHIKLHVPKAAATNVHNNLHKLEEAAHPPKRPALHKIIHHFHHHAPPSSSQTGGGGGSSSYRRRRPTTGGGKRQHQHGGHNSLLENVVVSEVKDPATIDSDHLDYLNHASEIAKHVAQIPSDTYHVIDEKPAKGSSGGYSYKDASATSASSYLPPSSLSSADGLAAQYSAYKVPKPEYGVPSTFKPSAPLPPTGSSSGGYHFGDSRPGKSSASSYSSFHSPQSHHHHNQHHRQEVVVSKPSKSYGEPPEDYQGYSHGQATPSNGFAHLSDGYAPSENLIPPAGSGAHGASYGTYEDETLAGIGELITNPYRYSSGSGSSGGGKGSLAEWPEPPDKFHASETYTGYDSYNAVHVQGLGSGGYAYSAPFI